VKKNLLKNQNTKVVQKPTTPGDAFFKFFSFCGPVPVAAVNRCVSCAAFHSFGARLLRCCALHLVTKARCLGVMCASGMQRQHGA
jgi:hypothetical protein